MGGSRLLVAGEDEGTGILDGALLVEGIEDELLDCFRHRRGILARSEPRREEQCQEGAEDVRADRDE